MAKSIPQRILAVNPGMHHLGVAVFEDETLIWYGIKTFQGRSTSPNIRPAVRQYLTDIWQKYEPTALAVEDPFYAASLLSQELKKLTRDIKTWGKWKSLKVFSYTPPEVKAFFCRDLRTKQSLAEAMIREYPFLARYLGPLGWKRRYWFHVFDAVGLGLMCVRKLGHSKASPRERLIRPSENDALSPDSRPAFDAREESGRDFSMAHKELVVPIMQ